jgi:hypothetical protein
VRDLERKPASRAREREREPAGRHDPSERAHALQRAAGNQVTAALAGGVAPLTPDARAKLERAYGVDLVGVRIHSGRAAAEKARSQRAIAFTRGADVYLGPAAADERVLAHELGHVVQQSEPATAVPKLPAASLEAEATGGEVTVGAATPGSVQGFSEEEEEEPNLDTKRADAIAARLRNDPEQWREVRMAPEFPWVLQQHPEITQRLQGDPEYAKWVQNRAYVPPPSQHARLQTEEQAYREKHPVAPPSKDPGKDWIEAFEKNAPLLQRGKRVWLKDLLPAEWYGAYERMLDAPIGVIEAIPGGKLGRLLMELALGEKVSGRKVDRAEKAREVVFEAGLQGLQFVGGPEAEALGSEAGAAERGGARVVEEKLGGSALGEGEETLLKSRKPEVIPDKPAPEPTQPFEPDAPKRVTKFTDVPPDTEAVARPPAAKQTPPSRVMAGRGSRSSFAGLETEPPVTPDVLPPEPLPPAGGSKPPPVLQGYIDPAAIRAQQEAARKVAEAALQAERTAQGEIAAKGARALASGADPAARLAVPDVTPRSFPGPKKRKGKKKLPGLPGKDVVEPNKPEPVEAPRAPHPPGEVSLPSKQVPEQIGDEEAPLKGIPEEPGRRGLTIEISQRRKNRLKKAEEMAKKGGKWPDLPSDDRSGLGRAYNAIIEKLVREIASGGRARVLHWPQVNKKLIDELAKEGGRVVITEGQLYGGKLRFDIAEIDFKNKTVELIDLTSLQDKGHAGKTNDYADALEKLTGFPVSACEIPYVGEDGQLLDDLVPIPVKRGGGK